MPRLLLFLLLLVPVSVTAQNLHPQPDLATAQGWTLTRATHQSGMLQLGQHTTALGPSMAITPGQTYTCGVYFRGEHAPTDFLRLSLALYDSRGKHLRNSPSATDYAYAQPGVWQEGALFHAARADERSMRLLLSRAIALDGQTPVQIDQVYCRAGVALDQPPSPKRPFHGGLVQVDATGKVHLRQPDGTRKQEFLRCMFAIGTEDWRSYAPNGWNCNMWISSLGSLERSVKAGMPYAFFQLAQYIHKGGWAYGNLTALRRDLGAILTSPYADHLIGYYYDNESPDQIAMAQQVLAVVAELDTKNGQRQRPIYILDGNPGRHLAYTGMADITGTYAFGGGNTHLRLLQNLPGQTTPVVFGQIQQERGKTATSMRAQVLGVLSDGGAAIGYWHTNPIAKELWYKDFPAIVAAALHCTPSPPCAAGPQEAQAPRPTPPPVSLPVPPPIAPPVSPPSPPASTPQPTCTHYASPGGGGSGLSQGSPFHIADFWTRARPGSVLCLLDGTYRGAQSMIRPPTSLAGTASQRITIRALHDGKVTIDGEHRIRPVDLQGQYGRLTGVNVRRGDNANIALRGKNWLVQRVVSFDGQEGTHLITGNNSQGGNVIEDCAAFGSGEKMLNFGSSGGSAQPGNTIRRCWSMFTATAGSTAINGAEQGYGQDHVRYENLLVTVDMDRAEGNPSGMLRSFRTRGSTMEGVIVYLPRDATGGNFNTMASVVTDGGSPYDPGARYRPTQGSHYRDMVAYVHPQHPRFDLMTALLFGYAQKGPVGTGNTVTNVLGVSGKPSVFNATSYTFRDIHQGTTLPDALRGSGHSSIWTLMPRVCKRVVNGTLTGEGLWPWPMNQRIQEALRQAGRSAHDVTATMEDLFEAIPPQCRGAGSGGEEPPVVTEPLPAQAGPACTHYASPSGGGSGTSQGSPFRISEFWSVAKPGTVLCLLDGTYRGAPNLLRPPATVKGTASQPVTVRALHDGKATLDGQDMTHPVLIDGNAWLVFAGFNAHSAPNASGLSSVIRVRRSSDIAFKRVLAWDGGINGNDAIISAGNAQRVLFEDVAAWGTGRKGFSCSQGGNDCTCRRCWIRWEGGTAVGPKFTYSLVYNNYRNLIENSIGTWDGRKMPDSYSLYCPDVIPYGGCGKTYRGGAVDQPEAIFGSDGQKQGDPDAHSQILGSIAYVLPTDDFRAQRLFTMSGANHITMTNNVAVKPPTMHEGVELFHLPGAAHHVLHTNSTGIGGVTQLTNPNATVSGMETSTSGAHTAVSSVWTGGAPGANICTRYVDGKLTRTPLWPWPMNQRILEGLAQSGRPPVDVTATIERLLGPIPAQCRGEGDTPPVVALPAPRNLRVLNGP